MSEPNGRAVLEAFLVQGEKFAFRTLVKLHGPMVLSVCRRVLHDLHDAEDAFQATFLVLIRKAASIGKRRLLANWLYGVAYRTALQARKANARRKAKERNLQEMGQHHVDQDDAMRELLPVLDQELSRLPDMYRVAIVLCDLEGNTRKEAAKKLQVPEGTLSTRLTRRGAARNTAGAPRQDIGGQRGGAGGVTGRGFGGGARSTAGVHGQGRDIGCGGEQGFGWRGLGSSRCLNRRGCEDDVAKQTDKGISGFVDRGRAWQPRRCWRRVSWSRHLWRPAANLSAG